MDDDLPELEAELKRLRPAAPSPELVQRIGRELPARPAGRARTTLRWVWLATVPAAAALAVLLSRSTPPRPDRPDKPLPAATASSGALKPVSAENVLYSARDEGLVVLEDGTPARRERLQFVDTITWRDPRTNASLTWTVPREEVRVVPISFQ